MQSDLWRINRRRATWANFTRTDYLAWDAVSQCGVRIADKDLSGETEFEVRVEVTSGSLAEKDVLNSRLNAGHARSA